MPAYDFECQKCGDIAEHVYRIADCPEELRCDRCGGTAKKIISIGGQNIFREEAPWLNSVLEVVDKDPSKTHCRAFLNEPTRANYKRWMKGERIRPLEPGEEKRRRPERRDRRKAIGRIMRNLQEARGGAI